MARRKLIIGISVLGHAALLVGVSIRSAWDIDRLDPDTRRPLSLAALGPPPAEAGGMPDLPKPKDMQPKVTPKEVTGTRQPRKPQDLKFTIETSGTGTGQAAGPGHDGVPGDTDGPCRPEDGDCGPTPPIVPPPPEPPKLPEVPPRGPVTVAPQILKGLRLSGETAIHPPREVATQMVRDGNLKTSGSLKVCITSAGAIASVAVLKSTGYAAYDEALTGAARRWIYRPYTAGGTPVPVCSVVTFLYAMQ